MGRNNYTSGILSTSLSSLDICPLNSSNLFLKELVCYPFDYTLLFVRWSILIKVYVRPFPSKLSLSVAPQYTPYLLSASMSFCSMRYTGHETNLLSFLAMHEYALCSEAIGIGRKEEVKLYQITLALWQKELSKARSAHKATYIEKEILRQCLSRLERLQGRVSHKP